MLIEKISQIQLELTTKCNAKCPQCARNYYGSYTWPSLPIVDIDPQWLKDSISLETWQGLEHIRLCGTYGDPCMYQELIELISWIKSVSPAKITINTNGSIRNIEWWQQLAEILDPQKDTVFFSIDGLADTNHLHRIGVDFNLVIKNLYAFNTAGGSSIWSYLVFEHNQHQVDDARDLAKRLGCKEFVYKSTSRFVDKTHQQTEQTPILTDLGQPIYFLKPTNLPKYQNKGYDDLVEINKEYGNYENYLNTTAIDCDAKRKYYIYISAEGDVFPCGWLADRLYGYEAENHKDHLTVLNLIGSVGGREKISIRHTKIEDIVFGPWFQAIENSWQENKIHRCSHMCGTKSTLINHANTELNKIGLLGLV